MKKIFFVPKTFQMVLFLIVFNRYKERPKLENRTLSIIQPLSGLIFFHMVVNLPPLLVPVKPLTLIFVELAFGGLYVSSYDVIF